MAASVVPTSTSVQVADNAKEDSVADRTDVNGKENVVLTSVKATEFSMAGAELQSSEQLQETGFLAIKNGLPSVDQHGVSYVPYESERQLPDIMELMKSDLSEPYSIYTFRYFIHQWPKLCILARFDGDCVGAIVCKLDFHRSMIRRGYIAMLAVHRNHRRKHIGSSLVKRVIGQMMADGCDEVVLEADVSNEAALSLYANLGFVRDKYLHRYYLNGADAYRQLQATAKNREFMKNRILTPMGQLLHRMDLFIRMRVMGLAGPVEVKPLKDSVALESGADVLGEIFVFSVGAGILTAEYFRLSNKEAKREEYELEKISELVSSLNRVNATIQQMEGEVTELKSRVEQVECAKVNKK